MSLAAGRSDRNTRSALKLRNISIIAGVGHAELGTGLTIVRNFELMQDSHGSSISAENGDEYIWDPE